jgi:hypothetical protein
MSASRPRRILTWLAFGIAGLLGVPLLALGGVVLALNLPAGRAAVETLAPRLSGGMVVLHGLAGRFPDALRVGQIRVADAAGAWLTIEDVQLDWSPRRLLAGVLRIDLLRAGRIALTRLPVAAPAAPTASTGGAGFTLPLPVALRRLRVETLDLGAGLAGVAARFSLDGEARLASLTAGEATLSLHRLDGAGQYRLGGPGGARWAGCRRRRGLAGRAAGAPPAPPPPPPAATSSFSWTPPGATTLHAFTTPRARSTRSRMRCFLLISRNSLDAIWAKVARKSGEDPTSTTSVVAHPASAASRSSSIKSTVFPTPRRP